MAVNGPRVGRHDDILVVFTELVARQGYDQTSVSEIAERLQLSKGTVMYHFGSKDQMLRELSLGYMERRLIEIESIVATIAAAPDRLRAVIEALVRSYYDDRDASVAFSREFMRFADEPVMDDVRELRRRYVGLLQQIIEGGITEGSFARTDARVVAFQLVGMCNWLWTWLEPGGRLSYEEICALYADTLLRGLATRDDAGGVSPFDVVTIVDRMS